MLDCQALYDALAARGADFYAGVPDSLLKDFCAYVTDHAPAEAHIITANEGTAIGLAAGHYLGGGGVPVVYLQNSGLGNAVNPLTSLCDPKVYGIPTLVVVGWRGEPGKKDAPQHVKMGGVTRELLDAIEVPWAVLPDSLEAAEEVLDRAFASMRERQAPFALVVPKGTFAKYKLQNKTQSPYEMTRERAIELLCEAMPADALVVSTTGMPSRELFEVRARRGDSHDADFLTVGSMGHSSQIALGVALAQPQRPVWCLDGDGAAIMHLGGLTTIASQPVANYRHVVLNNGAHDSVGGQPTVAFDLDLCKLAEACGYKSAVSVDSEASLAAALKTFAAAEGPALLEVRIKIGARGDLGRPTMPPQELKQRFRASATGE